MSWPHLPHDTRAALGAKDRLGQCRNLGLLLEKYAPWTRDSRRWFLGYRAEAGAKGAWLQQDLAGSRRIETGLVNAHYKRWAARVEHMGAKPFYPHTDSRLLVGLGADSVLETSLTLHRLYGFPVIPGSALKGLARTQALMELAHNLGVPVLDPEAFLKRKPPAGGKQRKTPLNKLEDLLEAPLASKLAAVQKVNRRLYSDLLEDKLLGEGAAIREMPLEELTASPGVTAFRRVFGSLDGAGSVVFADGVPVVEEAAAALNIVVDVMNPHYARYYQGKSDPSDDDKPVPIQFLALERGARFAFAVAPRRRGDGECVAAAEDAKRWLATALRDMGIGAKTAAGYGFFVTGGPVKFEPAGPEPTKPRPTPDPEPERVPDEPEPDEDEGVKQAAKDFMDFLKSRE